MNNRSFTSRLRDGSPKLALPCLAMVAYASAGLAPAASSLYLPVACSQIIVVTSPSWEASSGKLQAFERNDRGEWHSFGRSSDVRLGRRGLAWGRGLSSTSGPQKREGDNKSPAGLFPLSFAFGYDARSPSTRMRYVPITEKIVCVDDPRSRFYNQMLDATKVGRRDWKSAEKMKLRDDRYQWGVFVSYNIPARPGAGSCIFLHVWKDRQTPTTGCTAMPEPVMLGLIKWLDPSRHPLLVQLPADIYREATKTSNVPPM